MLDKQEQRNDQRTSAAELSPELRYRLLSAMLELQQEIRRNVELRQELAARLQPEPPHRDVIARMKRGVLAEVQRQRQNERAERNWRRGLVVSGAVCAMLILLVVVWTVNFTTPPPAAEEQQLVMQAPAAPQPEQQTGSVAKVTRIYAVRNLDRKCECSNELYHTDCTGGFMCEDSLQCEDPDGSVLMIRVPNTVEFNPDKDVI